MRPLPWGENAGWLVVVPLLAVGSFCSPASSSESADPEIEALQRVIDANGYHWTARRTWVTNLAPEEFERLLGLVVPPEVERRFAVLQPEAFPRARNLRSTWDWRDHGGETVLVLGQRQDAGVDGDLAAREAEGVRHVIGLQQLELPLELLLGRGGDPLAHALHHAEVAPARDHGVVLRGLDVGLGAERIQLASGDAFGHLEGTSLVRAIRRRASRRDTTSLPRIQASRARRWRPSS